MNTKIGNAAEVKDKKAPPAPESFGLPHTGVETHAHLNGKYFAQDREAALDRAKKAGLARIGQVFMSSERWASGREYFAQHPEVFFLLAIHPTEAQNFKPAELEAMRVAIRSDKRIKAVGETGLDYYWQECPPDVQREVFRKHLNLAKEAGLPVVVHCRDAVEDTFAILREEGFKDYPLLWHCFGGDKVFADRILEMGWHISVPGTVTFPANRDLRAAVAHIPLDRLMMETDCPFLTPVPHRGERNEPAYLAFTIQTMAEAKGMAPADLWTKCGETAIRFFSLDPL